MILKPSKALALLFSSATAAAAAASGATARKVLRASPTKLAPVFPNLPIPSLLHACSLEGLKAAHAAMVRNGAHQDCFHVNQFVAACARLRRMDYALRVFAQVTQPNIFVYNAVIGGLVRRSEPAEGVGLYIAMLRSDVVPDGYTFSSVVRACAQLSTPELGRAVHGQIVKMGFGRRLLVQTVLVDFYCSSNEIGESRRLFDEMSERDIVSWTAMIHGYARLGDLASARRLFDEMPERNVVSWNTMIAGYGKAGDIESAVSMFDKMPEKNLISWTTMISCYSQNRKYKEAIETFKGMKAAGFSPDEVAVATTISACAHLGALDVGRELQLHAMLNRFDLGVHLGSALVDMYAKCGSLDKALVTFYKLEEKNLFCWNSIIEGLAIHGHGRNAINMFYKMNEEGKTKPNGVTFVSILGACNHAGLVEEARRMFSSMMEEYSIWPEMEHYGCMVDLLGRAGHVEEALALTTSMPMEPNSAIWLALLSGCRIHRNMEVGEIAAMKLLVLEPDNSAHYTLLVSIYAEAKAWDKVEWVRGMMKEKGVQKTTPGCSWIDIDGVVLEFSARDMIHLSSNICLLLLGLDRHLKIG